MSSVFRSGVDIFCLGITQDQGLLVISEEGDGDCAICNRIGWYRFKTNNDTDWFRDSDIATVIIR